MIDAKDIEDRINYKLKSTINEKTVIQIKFTDQTGKGFISQILRGRIQYPDGKHNHICKDVIIKVGTDDKLQRKLVAITPMMKREADFYKIVAPKYEHYNSLCDTDIFNLTLPKCLLLDVEYTKEILVIEDMTKKDFVIMCKKNCDYEHSVIAMKTLAKFHGMGLLLKKLEPNIYSQLAKKFEPFVYLDEIDDYQPEGYRFYTRKMIPVFLESIQDENLKNKCSEKININTFREQVRETWTSGKLKLLTHCDYWMGNILFKYERGVSVDAAPIDFQVVRISSIANDILFFFSGSSESGVRKKYFWQMVEIYYEHFKQFMASRQSNLEDFFSLDELKEEIKAQSFIIFAVGVCYLGPFCLDTLPTAYDLHTERIPQKLLEPSNEYIQRVNDLVNDFVGLGIL